MAREYLVLDLADGYRAVAESPLAAALDWADDLELDRPVVLEVRCPCGQVDYVRLSATPDGVQAEAWTSNLAEAGHPRDPHRCPLEP